MNEETIRRVAILSFLLNVGLVILKMALSYITGSLALRADAVHSMVDVFASIALIIGLEISNRKSKNFPYGLYKVENIASVIISLLLFLTAYEISIDALIGNALELKTYDTTVLLIVGALVPIPYLFGRYQITVGNKTNSPSLIADGIQHKADVFTSLLVFLALATQRLGLPIDRISAIVIAVFIMWEGWDILKSGMKVLLDASVDNETLEKIRLLIREEPVVSELKEVTARNSGRYLFVEASVVLKVLDLNRAHQAALNIEDKIRRSVVNVDRVLIHYEPRTKDLIRYAVPLVSMNGDISLHFGEAPYFALVDIDIKHGVLKRQEIIANPFQDLDKGKGLKVAEYLLRFKPDTIVTQESLVGKGPGYAFAEAGTRTIQTDKSALSELVDESLIQNPDEL